MWNPFKPDELHQIVIRARVLKFLSERKGLDSELIALYQKLEDAASALISYYTRTKKVKGRE